MGAIPKILGARTGFEVGLRAEIAHSVVNAETNKMGFKDWPGAASIKRLVWLCGQTGSPGRGAKPFFIGLHLMSS